MRKRTRPPDEPVEIDATSPELEFSSTATSADPDSDFEPGDWHHRRSEHTWYLDTTTVPLALLDKNVSVEKKAAIADTLLSFHMMDSDFFKHRHKDQRDTISVIEKMKTSTLAPLIDEFSHLMFLNNRERVRDWLSLPPQYWHSQSSFQNFQKFAKTLIIVNNDSE